MWLRRARLVVPATIGLVLGCQALWASEASRHLVAKGRLAYHAGRYDEARALFADAVSADEGDAEAHQSLGLAFACLDRWSEAVAAFERALELRPDFPEARDALEVARTHTPTDAAVSAPASKPWELHMAVGGGYDSNPAVEPDSRGLRTRGDRGDATFVLSGGGRYDVLSNDWALVRLEYDLYQTLHPELDDFDFRSHRVRATGSIQAHRGLWVGLQGGYTHYTLGPHSYLSEPFALPFASMLWGEWGLTQVTYRHGDETYLTRPFHDMRDGPNDSAGVSQTFYLDDRRLTLGYQFESARPRRSIGDDYRLASQQGYVSLGLPIAWEVDADLMYVYRSDGYTEPNSFTGFQERRHDDVHYFYAAVSRPLTDHLSVAVTYQGTINDSNVDVFEYRRNVVAMLFQVSY